MKTLYILILLLSVWTCQSSRGHGLGIEDAFEDRLIQLYSADQLRDTLELRTRLVQWRQAIRQSNLDASAKVDVWLYLQQLSQATNFEQMPVAAPDLQAQLSTFVTPAEQKAISRSAALAYFRQTYLDQLLSPPNRNRSFYQLNAHSELLNELMIYPFQEVNSLLEIGVGDGGFGVLMQLFFQLEEHYLNEVDSQRMLSIQRQLELLPEELARPKVVLGSNEQIGLGSEKVEAVLIRNALHHFETPEALLADIKKHLLPGGRLYLFEEVKDPISGHQHCEAAMTLDEIRFLLQIEGFRWVENHTVLSEWKKILVFEPTGSVN